MTQKMLTGLSALFVLGFLVLSGALFTVDEREKALVLQFGELVHIHDTPGLKMKIPFIQEIVSYDRRLLDYNVPPTEIIAKDQKRIIMDVFTRYVISDPLLFYKTVRTEAEAKTRLASIVPGSMRRVVGQVTLSQILSEERTEIMDHIHQEVRGIAKSLGVDVRDIRIIRADLPPENSQAIFERMESARKLEAKLLRAEGQKMAQEIQSKADRKRSIILAEAKKTAALTRGAGDAEAAKIYASAYGQDPDFFQFFRSMQAYKEAFTSDYTTFVLTPDNEFFQMFEKPKINRKPR